MYETPLPKTATSSCQVRSLNRHVSIHLNSFIVVDDIYYLPMSDVADWSEDVKTGKLLDRSKPTLCVSSQGAGSIKIANFLASVVGFEEV